LHNTNPKAFEAAYLRIDLTMAEEECNEEGKPFIDPPESGYDRNISYDFRIYSID
jgi:hypothetical protein